MAAHRAAVMLVTAWLLAAAGLANAATPTIDDRAIYDNDLQQHQGRSQNGPYAVPIRHGPAHGLRKRSEAHLQHWALRERVRIMGKYGPTDLERRHSGPLSSSDDLEERNEGLGDNHDESDVIRSRRRDPPERRPQVRQINGDLASQLSRAVASSVATPNPNAGRVNLTNWESDLEYYAPLHVGTPPQRFNIILDTGSADFWLVDSNCTSRECNKTQTFVGNRSSSMSSPIRSFNIAYGAGSASGTLLNETIALAGLQLTNQTVGLADSVGDSLIAGNASGIMGLGFSPLSVTRATPLWQNFINMSSPYITFPGFSFYFTRFINATSAAHAEFGGLFTLGTLSNASFAGPLTWFDIPANTASYWVIPMQAITLNGQNLTNLGTPNVAIDTGTTLIGGPSAVVEQFYTQIGGAYALDGAYEGYYTYPCNANISIAFQFGNMTYNMSAEDLNLGIFRGNQCLGSFFDLTLSSGSAQVISWVIGGAFLKNVYTAFRARPGPSVGFAALSPAVLAIDNPASPSSSAVIAVTAPSGIIGGPTGSVNGSMLPTGSPLPPGTTTRRASAGLAAQDRGTALPTAASSSQRVMADSMLGLMLLAVTLAYLRLP